MDDVKVELEELEDTSYSGKLSERHGLMGTAAESGPILQLLSTATFFRAEISPSRVKRAEAILVPPTSMPPQNATGSRPALSFIASPRSLTLAAPIFP